MVLSDHGQSPGETFRARYGLTLGDLVRAGCGLPVPRRAQRTRSGAEARNTVRAALHRPVEEGAEQQRPADTPTAAARSRSCWPPATWAWSLSRTCGTG